MSGKKTKMLSFVAVLMMVGTVLAVVPFVSGTNGDEYGNLTISVQDKDVNPVNGYYIELCKVVDGEKYVYEDLSFAETLRDIEPGYYEVIFPTQEIGNTVYFRNSTTIAIYPDETSNIDFTVNYSIESLIVSGYVNDSEGNLLENATVTIIDSSVGFSKSVLTNETGYYETKIYPGHFLVEIEYSNYTVNYTYVNIYSNIQINGTLTNKPYIWGSILDEEGKVISGEVTLILYDKNNDETLVHVSESGAYMIPAYEGNFSMFINADGYNTYYISDVNCDGNSIRMDEISLTHAKESSLRYEFSFNSGDFNNLSVKAIWRMSPANTINALPGNNLGNIRLQVDNFFGNMDGTVNQSEAQSFIYWFDSHGVITSTKSIISVNSTYYKLDDGGITYTIQGLEGDVNSSDPIYINTSFSMSSYSNISGDNISVDLSVKYDGDTNYSYSIVLPEGYERTRTESSSGIDIDGFTSIEIDPYDGTGTGAVHFIIEKSIAGNASISVATGDYVYEREDMNDTYIIQTGKDTVFTAIFTDPNGNEGFANYTWDFGDGNTKYGKEVEHNYSSEGEYTVKLTVKEAGGNITTANITMQADGTPPSPSISTNKTSADEDSPIEFNASASSDLIYGTVEGIIREYRWDFGDNTTSTQKVVDHSYEKWGTYTVRLTVVDAVGNSANITKTITINDITPPVARFNWTVDTGSAKVNYSYSNGGTISIKEGDKVIFNAEPSYDPDGYGENGIITSYLWTLKKGDEEIAIPDSTSMVIEYTFETPGSYTMILNVTDAHGNYNEFSKIIDVKYGPRPRLEVSNLTLSTNSPVEGEKIYIIANVSNFGDADANSPNIVFYVNGEILNGDVKFYKYENGTLVESPSVIPKGEYRIVKIAWIPAQETYTIKVNATDMAEPPGSSITHEKEIRVTVGPAAWKGMIPIIVLIVVIIAIVGVYYAYTRGMGPFGEGKKKESKKGKK